MVDAGSSSEASRGKAQYSLEIIVSDPQKHSGEQSTSSAYVSYQISTKTDNPAYHEHSTNAKNIDDIIVVHRRYSDLVLLHSILLNDYPTCIIPPLPDKKVLKYIAGDRFSQSFTQKRCHSIQNFLRRVTTHPKLSKSSVLEMCLVSGDWDVYRKSLSGKIQTNKEDVTDAFMNAFKSVHNQNEEFLEIKERSDKLDQSISKINKVMGKACKKQESIYEDFSKLADRLRELQELVSHENSQLSNNLNHFQNGIQELSYGIRDLNKYLEYEYLVDLKDLEHYIDNMRQLMKLKDQKQIDYEELSEYLNKAVNEKNNLISGYGSGGAGPSFLTNKLEEIAGINKESSRREKINKLENKITSLHEELEKAKKVADVFESETLKEVEMFEALKTKELTVSLDNLADHHIEFYEKMLDTWTKIDDNLS